MNLDYQIILDLLANIGIIVFPIALIFEVCERVIDFFLSFVSGRRVDL